MADEAEIADLFGAILDGGIADLELGAVVVALHKGAVSASSMTGAYRATSARMQHLRAAAVPYRPLVFSSYGSPARRMPNLLPWLALALKRLGVPVVIHGSLGGAFAGNTAHVLRELDVMPSATLAKAQSALFADRLAFVPVGLLCPGLAKLQALQTRLGLQDWSSRLAALLDPFRGSGVRIIGVANERLREVIEAVCREEELDALVFDSTDDDGFVDPGCRPEMTAIVAGSRIRLFEAERSTLEWRASLPQPQDVAATAEWTRQALAGNVVVPHPLVNQFACCLFLCGYAADMNQAKAIAAVESGALLASASAGVGGGTSPEMPQATG